MNALSYPISRLPKLLSLGIKSYSAEKSQTSLVDDLAWQSVIKNIERYNLQLPLPQSQIRGNQHICKIEKTVEQILEIFSEIKEEMDKNVAETNRNFLRLHKDIEELKSINYRKE